MVKLKLISCVLLIASLSACSLPAKIVNTYKEPGVVIHPDDLELILISVLARNESQRQLAEDKVAKNHPKFIQSYNYFPLGAGKMEITKAKRVVKEEGFDGALILRLVDEDNKVIYASEKLDVNYWDTHEGFWSSYYEPGYYNTETSYYIEVQLYRLTDEKMIWSGLSSIVDPSRVDFAVESVLEATIKEMRAEGFLD
jgi:hypothetical protein